MIKCFLCEAEENLETSHDIPRYIGGIDLDGRHLLCKKHHREYDLLLLNSFLKSIGEKELDNNCQWQEVCQWQTEIKSNPSLHPKFKSIAEEIKGKVFQGRKR